MIAIRFLDTLGRRPAPWAWVRGAGPAWDLKVAGLFIPPFSVLANRVSTATSSLAENALVVADLADRLGDTLSVLWVDCMREFAKQSSQWKAQE